MNRNLNASPPVSGIPSAGAAASLTPIQLPPLSEDPLISVLVSCYNYAGYVAECIQSVLRQSYPRFELIVSDDGSSDGSVEEVRRWAMKDERVHLVAGRHRGMAGALNQAWQQSSGQIICLLDADDIFLPGKLRAVADAFLSHPEVGYVMHRTCRTDAAGKRFGVSPMLKCGVSGWCADRTLAGGGVLADVPPSSNLSFRREVLERIFPLPEVLDGFAELLIQRLAPLLTSVLRLDQALATWRLHETNDANTTRMSDDRLEREVTVIERVWEIQRSFLERWGGKDAASALQPLTCSEYYCRMQYLLARGQSPADCASWRLRLLNAPGFKERPFPDRVLWRIAPAMPARAMNRILELTFTQNRAKEWITRMLRIGR